MILSKEIQEKAVNEYLQNNSVEKTQAFIDGMNKAFELIIPKEEPKQGTMSEAIKQVIDNQLKQETFEEAAKSHAIYELENNYKPTKESFKLACKRSFIQCAKWQQDQINCELSELLEFVKSLANESDDIVHPEIKKVAEQLIKK
jgi:hypothetical protein